MDSKCLIEVDDIHHGPLIVCVLLLASDIACYAQSTPQPPSPWTVVAVRGRRLGEVPFENASGYLRRSPDPNYVPGPDSLVVHVTIIERRGYVEILDLRTGRSRRLLDAWASLPQWSPDGRYVSCVVWRSVIKHHELTVVDVHTGNIVADPDVRASGTEAKWSPDSHKIAASGVIYGSPRAMLYTVSISGGTATILDSLDVLAAHDFSWSPDSRWLAFSKPTELDDMGEDPVAADLWIADVETGNTWPLLETPDWIESKPLWITDHTIQVNRRARHGDERGGQQTVVVELSDSRKEVSPHPE